MVGEEVRVHGASRPRPAGAWWGGQQRLYAGNISSFQVRSGTWVVISRNLSLELLEATSFSFTLSVSKQVRP